MHFEAKLCKYFSQNKNIFTITKTKMAYNNKNP